MSTTKAARIKAGRGPKEINWAITDQTVSHDEFMSAIKQAEMGPFYTVHESMNKSNEEKKQTEIHLTRLKTALKRDFENKETLKKLIQEP